MYDQICTKYNAPLPEYDINKSEIMSEKDWVIKMIMMWS